MAGCSITEAPSHEHDRALSPGEFDAVWRRYERYAAGLIRNALARAPLHDAFRFAGANGESSHLLAGVGSVRRSLASSDDLVEDALQELALALYSAIQQGRIRAAAPAIEAWLRTTAPRIARDAARGRSVLLFAAGDPSPVEGSDRQGEEREADEGSASREPDPSWLAETRQIVARVWSALPELLKPREIAVLQGWLEDRDHAEMAAELGTTTGNARILLHRALAAVRAMVGEARAGPNPARRPSCGLVDVFPGALLTVLYFCDIVDSSDIRPRPASWPLPWGSRAGSRLRAGWTCGIFFVATLVSTRRRASEHPARELTMATTHIDRSIYLGSAEDPQPIFRDEAADGATWPEGAVMAIAFTEERFPGAFMTAFPPHAVDYFDAGGWPLDLPVDLKRSLPVEMKREFQVAPLTWRAWNDSRWTLAHDDPAWFARLRAPSAVLDLLAFLPSPTIP